MKKLLIMLLSLSLIVLPSCNMASTPASSQEEGSSTTESSEQSVSSPEPESSEEKSVAEEVVPEISTELLLGKWTYVWGNNKYILWLNFLDDHTAEYVVGFYASEATVWGNGEYKIENGELILSGFVDKFDNSAIELDSKYKIAIIDDKMELTYIEGDKLYYDMDTSAPLVLEKEPS